MEICLRRPKDISSTGPDFITLIDDTETILGLVEADGSFLVLNSPWYNFKYSYTESHQIKVTDERDKLIGIIQINAPAGVVVKQFTKNKIEIKGPIQEVKIVEPKTNH